MPGRMPECVPRKQRLALAAPRVQKGQKGQREPRRGAAAEAEEPDADGEQAAEHVADEKSSQNRRQKRRRAAEEARDLALRRVPYGRDDA